MIKVMLDHWASLFENAATTRLAKGSSVFHRNDEVQSMHFIQSGTVTLTRFLRDGTQLTLHEASTGHLLAEASLFSENYHCDAVATGEVSLAVLPRRTVIDTLELNATSLPALERAFKQVQDLRARVEVLRLRRTSERLDAYLELKGAPEAGPWVDVAQWIGVTPPALYRELARRRGT